MKRMERRLLSLLLCLLMIFSSVGVSARAQEGTPLETAAEAVHDESTHEAQDAEEADTDLREEDRDGAQPEEGGAPEENGESVPEPAIRETEPESTTDPAGAAAGTVPEEKEDPLLPETPANQEGASAEEESTTEEDSAAEGAVMAQEASSEEETEQESEPPLDEQPPVITVTSAVEGHYNAEKSLYCEMPSFTVTDDVEIVSLTVNNIEVPIPQESKTSHTFTPSLSEQAGSVTVAVTDVGNNRVTRTVIVGHQLGGRGKLTCPATCTENEKTINTYTCATCKEVYYRYTVEGTQKATGHAYGEEQSIQGGCGPYRYQVCEKCGDIKVLEGADSPHTWDDTHIIVKEPGCDTEGGRGVKCTACGAVKVLEVIPAKGHLYSASYIIEDRTCVKDGKAGYHCLNCNDTKEWVLPATGAHTWTAKDGDCTKGMICSVCQTEGEHPQEHNVVSDWRRDANQHWKVCKNRGCTVRIEQEEHVWEEGVDCTKRVACTVCGYTSWFFSHNFEEHWQPGTGAYERYCIRRCVNPGCTEIRKSLHYTVEDYDCSTPLECSYCGKVVEEAKAHVFSEDSAKLEHDENHHWYLCQNEKCKVKGELQEHAGTEDGNCTTQLLCTTCGHVIRLGKIYHSFTGNYVQDGNGHRRLCANPGCEQRTAIQPHWRTVDDDDCTTAVKCVCGADVVPAQSAHDYGNWTDIGEEHTRICQRTGCTVSETKPHVEGATKEENRVEPSCTADGSYESVVYCKDCGKELSRETVTLQKTEHAFGQWQNLPGDDCDKDTQQRICDHCGFTETKLNEETQHEWELQPTIDQQPTCTEDGSQSIHCKKCQARKDAQVIEELGHDFTGEYVIAIPATCTENAVEKTVCRRADCDVEHTREQKDSAHGHQFETYIANGDATCMADGTETAKCIYECGMEDTRPAQGSQLQHEYDLYLPNGDATCTADGTKTAECIHGCGTEDTQPDEGSKLGHSWSMDEWYHNAEGHWRKCLRCSEADTPQEHSWSVTEYAAPTCTEDGTETQSCDICGEEKTRTLEHGHIWKASYTWSEELDSCQIAFVCERDSGHTETRTADVTVEERKVSCTEDGAFVYTAQTELDGNTYMDQKSVKTESAGHLFTHYRQTKAPTYAEAGEQAAVCDRCGEAEDRQLIPPLAAPPILPAPAASLESGSRVTAGTEVTLSCANAEAAIYYTLDGTMPTPAAQRYEQPIPISESVTVRAYAVLDEHADSPVFTASYLVVEDSRESDGVADGDAPSDGIPAGLWAAGLEDQEYIYTGAAIKPEVRVYFGKVRLQEKRDYSISCKNNKNAGTATITVVGKGNYSGKDTVSFEIRQKSISGEDVFVTDLALTSNGKVQKPVPTVLCGTKKLSKGRDFDLTYLQNEAVQDPKDPGEYRIRISGKGNYTGERTISLTMLEKGGERTLLSAAKISYQKTYEYTGQPIPLIADLRMAGQSLREGEDYQITYSNHTEIGTAKAVLTGIGKYAGVKVLEFKIVGRGLSNKTVTVENLPASVLYSGKAISPEPDVTDKKDGKKLEKGVDYRLSYQNNKKAGKATVLIEGMGNYSGTLKKTFQILPYDITEPDISEKKIQAVLDGTVNFEKGGSKPKPVVTFEGKLLTEGTDYKLSYQNGTSLNPAKPPTVKITGKGCFKGTLSKTYQLQPQDLVHITVTLEDRVFSKKKNAWKSAPVLTDVNGKKLSAGKDYDSKVSYTYDGDTQLEDGTVRKDGSKVESTDIPKAGTVIHVGITAKGGTYTGMVSATYRIVEQSIKNAKVTIGPQHYTGKSITLEKDQITVKVGGTTLTPRDFEIVGYQNNLKKGTATVVLHGTGNYGGTKSVKFKIQSKELHWMVGK